mmetsp:Transcript_27859/g.89817  ORF Transcript_27859/g.89817 Transcript_27859/m.89817 type:complete len:222 (+) Transcript_27859:575-1240(+)
MPSLCPVRGGAHDTLRAVRLACAGRSLRLLLDRATGAACSPRFDRLPSAPLPRCRLRLAPTLVALIAAAPLRVSPRPGRCRWALAARCGWPPPPPPPPLRTDAPPWDVDPRPRDFDLVSLSRTRSLARSLENPPIASFAARRICASSSSSAAARDTERARALIRACARTFASLAGAARARPGDCPACRSLPPRVLLAPRPLPLRPGERRRAPRRRPDWPLS